MSTNLLSELVANKGTYYLADGIYEQQSNIDQIIVRGDGILKLDIYVFDALEGRRNVTSEYVSKSVLPNGLRITPKNDEVFIAVEIREKNGNDFCGLELVLA